tara:strand:+ start:311 stop:532 length:222 start_codon:yes stop_codon:yes gene_type:complete
MRDKILDNLLKSGTSTLLACVFCYFTFSFMSDELRKSEQLREKSGKVLLESIYKLVDERKKLTQELIDCLKSK